MMYNKSTASGYRMFRAVYRWPRSRKEVAKLKTPGEGAAAAPFVQIGVHQREWGQQAYRFFEQAGYDPKVQPFGIALDPAKMKSEVCTAVLYMLHRHIHTRIANTSRAL